MMWGTLQMPRGGLGVGGIMPSGLSQYCLSCVEGPSPAQGHRTTELSREIGKAGGRAQLEIGHRELLPFQALVVIRSLIRSFIHPAALAQQVRAEQPVCAPVLASADEAGRAPPPKPVGPEASGSVLKFSGSRVRPEV